MKRKLTFISVMVLFVLLLSLFISPASAGFKPDLLKPFDPCREDYQLAGVNGAASPVLLSLFLGYSPPPVPAAPAQHEDGRLNYRVCRAPLALYMDENGDVEIWSTDDTNLYQKMDLKVAATAEEIAAALALAEETGEDVVVAGYVDGFALVAKADGTLKAEVIGEYGCDFMADGDANYGWCLGYEAWTIPFFNIEEDLPPN